MANVTAFRRLLAFPLSIHRLQHTNQSPGSPTRTPAWVSIAAPRLCQLRPQRRAPDRHGHGRHSQPRRDLLSLPLLQSPTDPGQPTSHLQPPSLGSPPARIPALPPVLLGPPHLPLRGILRRPEQRRLPRRPATVSFPQQFSACAVRHYRHPSVRVVSGWIQRVAPPPMHSAPHHRHRVARPGLALSVVIDEHGARLLPRGVDAT